MAEGGQDEKSSFGQFAKKHTKYGTTTKATYTNETYLKHYVKPGQTLQGIALKYAVTMEQIKRANSIWTNDSLFLREYLLIPLPSSPIKAHPTTSQPVMNGGPASLSASQNCYAGEIVTKQDLVNEQKMSRSSSHNKILDMKQHSAKLERDENDITAKDYLSKFDSSLAKIKNEVQRLEEVSK